MKAILAIIIGLVGLLMSACGGLFTAVDLGNTGTLIISVPSLIVGMLLLWGAHSLWKSRKS
jgi:hypothetical protein